MYGKHSATEALLHRPDVISKIYLSPARQEDENLVQAIKKAGLTFSDLKGNTGDCKESAAHQGVVVKIDLDKLIISYKDFIAKTPVNPDTSVVILGELEDPHNVGAVIRSAAALGLGAVFIPEHRGSPVTGAVIKVSVGMAFRVPLVKIGNINDTIKDLKSKGFWIYGLESEGTQTLPSEDFTQPTAFVLGNEATGLRVETKKNCDILLSIPMNKRTESLNAASSATVAFYAWSLKHPQALD